MKVHRLIVGVRSAVIPAAVYRPRGFHYRERERAPIKAFHACDESSSVIRGRRVSRVRTRVRSGFRDRVGMGDELKKCVV